MNYVLYDYVHLLLSIMKLILWFITDYVCLYNLCKYLLFMIESIIGQIGRTVGLKFEFAANIYVGNMLCWLQ